MAGTDVTNYYVCTKCDKACWFTTVSAGTIFVVAGQVSTNTISDCCKAPVRVASGKD